MTCCEHCGSELDPNSAFCPGCGVVVVENPDMTGSPAVGGSPAGDPAANGNPAVGASSTYVSGFAERINTPEFKEAMSKSNRTNVIIYVLLLLFLAPLLTFIASLLMPSSFGVLVGAYVVVEIIMIVIVINLMVKRFAGKSWDGRVTNQRVTSEREGNTSHRRAVYVTQFVTDDGKKKAYKERTVSPFYDYLEVGDYVRYHPRLNYPFEKYEKNLDYLVCPFCSIGQPVGNGYCKNCKKPLLVDVPSAGETNA